MTEETNLSPNSDERMMGALAHFFGVIGALIIWVVQKDKSRFVRFQAVQALAFDFAVMLFTMVLSVCLMSVIFIGMFGTIFAALNNNSSSESFGPFMVFPLMFPMLMFTCIFPFSLAFLVARVVAAVSVLSGKNFHYPLLGTKVEQFLADQNQS
jgi:uncharacterized Tic20 family protein